MIDSQGVKKSSVDWMLVLITAVLVILGLIMQYSASSYNMSLVKKQGIFAVIGFAAMFLIGRFPVWLINKLSIPFYIFALGITAVTSVVGKSVKGASRWIQIGGITFQPSELLKAVMILALAVVICRHINEINNPPGEKFREAPAIIRETGFGNYIHSVKGYLVCLVIVGVAAMDVILATKDLGTGIIIFGIGFLIMWVISPRRGYLAAIGALAAVAAGALVAAFSYRMNRVSAWLNPENDKTDLGYQIRQGLYAIGSGGWFGKGLGRSIQKDVIPEPQTDMIFTVVCEELGIIGGMIIILLFVLMILRLRKIYHEISDLFGKITVLGVTCHIALQTIINLAVVTNLIPNTGVPLPFISYGGTSLLCLLGELGLVLCVRRTSIDTGRMKVYDSRRIKSNI